LSSDATEGNSDGLGAGLPERVGAARRQPIHPVIVGRGIVGR